MFLRCTTSSEFSDEIAQCPRAGSCASITPLTLTRRKDEQLTFFLVKHRRKPKKIAPYCIETGIMKVFDQTFFGLIITFGVVFEVQGKPLGRFFDFLSGSRVLDSI